MPIGWTPVPYFSLIKEKKIKVRELSTVEGVIEMLLSKRVDGIYLNADVIQVYLKTKGREGEAMPDLELPYFFSYFLLSTKKHPEIIKEFDAFLIANELEIKKIKMKYQFKFDKDPKLN